MFHSIFKTQKKKKESVNDKWDSGRSSQLASEKKTDKKKKKKRKLTRHFKRKIPGKWEGPQIFLKINV